MTDYMKNFTGTVTIRRNSDGLVRTYKDKELGDDGEGLLRYIWAEGNYSCDCNRYLFFQRAADEDESDERPCGKRGYTVLSIVDDSTGETVYSESA